MCIADFVFFAISPGKYIKIYANFKMSQMKNTKQLITASLFMLFTLIVSAEQFSKSDQAVIANYSISVEMVNQYMLFEKGFGAAKAAEPKYASLTPPRSLDEKINFRFAA